MDLVPSEPPVLGNIPWVYGEDRVTAMARDPQWIFVYWEVTDDAFARARAQVNDGNAGVFLRVYDTTFRMFDGTNANWYMDVPVHRPANNHYVFVNHPGSMFHIDIGVKSHDGYFAKIARSGAVEMPRNAVSPDTRVDWMTVTSQGGAPPDYEHRFVSKPATPPPEPQVERLPQSLAGEGWTQAEWTETDMGGRTVRWIRWNGPYRREQWRTEGRFERVEIVFEGERRVIRLEHGGERVVFGPWRVTIFGINPEGARHAIDRWSVYYSWPTEKGYERIETAPILHKILGGHRGIVVQVGSESRLMSEFWSSESLMRGASEWRWLGGSETWLSGASETFYLGASETRILGASETILQGASERLFVGSSFLGASEILYSEARP